MIIRLFYKNTLRGVANQIYWWRKDDKRVGGRYHTFILGHIFGCDNFDIIENTVYSDVKFIHLKIMQKVSVVYVKQTEKWINTF